MKGMTCFLSYLSFCWDNRHQMPLPATSTAESWPTTSPDWIDWIHLKAHLYCHRCHCLLLRHWNCCPWHQRHLIRLWKRRSSSKATRLSSALLRHGRSAGLQSFESNFEVLLVVMKVLMARMALGLSILVAAIFNDVLSLGFTLGTLKFCWSHGCGRNSARVAPWIPCFEGTTSAA